jgi:hypothetical protein
MKAFLMGVAALGLTAAASAAEEWEAIAISDAAVMAVDWESLQINGSMRRINTSLVTVQSEAGQFDYATSLLDVDCSRPRYKTIRSSFFYIDGRSASEDYVGDDSWTNINAGAIMGDVRDQVCAATTGKQGYFDDARSFAVGARRVMQEQG